jgi:lipopolysaccharide export system protein LptA
LNGCGPWCWRPGFCWCRAGGFLAEGKLKNPLNLRSCRKSSESTSRRTPPASPFDHALGGHSRYRIHASKASQYKDNHAILHDVKIELYGEDGSRVDRIEGAEFDYDQKGNTATATGPVEITLMRPGASPGQCAKGQPGRARWKSQANADCFGGRKRRARRDSCQDQRAGLRHQERCGDDLRSMWISPWCREAAARSGATYDSKGLLVLDQAVELNTSRNGDTVADSCPARGV